MEAQGNVALLHRKEWQTMMPALLATAAGSFVIADDSSEQDFALYMASNTVHYLYSHREDDWVQIPSGAFAVALAAGACGTYLPWSKTLTANAYRATRLVVMPEWQGVGVGTAFLNAICQYHLEGNGLCNKSLPTFFHTSHPQLCGALRKSKKWVQTSAVLYGSNKARSKASIKKSHKDRGSNAISGAGYGGHFRAVQGFKYLG